MRICESFRHASAATRLLPAAFAVVLASYAAAGQAQPTAFLPGPFANGTTVPANGDLNPYGVAFVNANFQDPDSLIKAGVVLVSNFNNSANLQGTGSTIVGFGPKGKPGGKWFQGSSGIGLSTALGILQKGFIVVGNAPSTNGQSSTAGPGSLLVINNEAKLVQTITDPNIQSPWDMTLVDNGATAIAFISNALTGNVSRLNFNVTAGGLTLTSSTVIASGYVHRGDPVTFFVSPTGLVYDAPSGNLYVASTGDNEVFVIANAATISSDAGMGTVVYQDDVHLHGPLAMVEAPNGHLLVSNNDGINPDPNQPSEIVEFTKQGAFVKELSVDPNPGGAFGMAIYTVGDVATFAAVDDNTNSLLMWTLDLN